MKSVIIYHKVDFDGVFSCCVVEDYLDNLNECEEYDTIGYTYGDNIDEIIEKIKNYNCDQVIMADVSFPIEKMKWLRDNFDFIWIDHHSTSIQESIDNNYDNIKGIRGTKVAACEYCWEYFHPNVPCPDVIRYISAGDTWNKTEFDWENVILPIQLSLRNKYGVLESTIYDNFYKLLYNYENIIDSLISSGKDILNYLKKSWKSAVKNYSFEILINNRFKGIAILSTEFTSNVFSSINEEDYDITCIVNRKDSDLYNISLYVSPEKELNFSVGEYLKEYYNGGGHKKAAGGKLNLEQFIRLVKDKKL